MKKIYTLALITLALAACVNDDKYDWESDFADLTATDTLDIAISYQGSSATITGDDKGYVTANGAHVTVKSNSNKFLRLSLSGTTDDGSLTIYSWKKLGISLNGVSITNPTGPAINNQCGKAFYVVTANGTVNTLTDGAAYQDRTNEAGETIDQKATLFSEGQIYFLGSGTLNINGNAKNGIASDDYIVCQGGTLIVNVAETGSNGIKVNDGFTQQDGQVTISVAANGSRGIRNESRTTINGGTLNITTTGACKIETIDGVNDTTSCAGIKSDSLFTMTAGRVTITSTGDGGKGINCSENIELSGGTLYVVTKGGNVLSKPKAVKSDTGIILSGGSFTAMTSKSWACDNGYDSDTETDDEIAQKRVTIIGTPQSVKLKKKETIVIF
jgi:hypothetical protein